MNLMIVPGFLIRSSFPINVSMFIVSKALFISSATMIVHAGGSIWLNRFGSVYVGGYCGLSESGLCGFGKLCLVDFFCKNSSVLL